MGALEKSRLGELERTIAGGLQTFVEVGAALAEVRDERLYKEAGFGNFESYCKERWGWTRRHADQLIGASVTSGRIENRGSQNPSSERQIRPLTKLPAEKQVEAWDIAVQKAVDREQPITGPLVQEAVGEVIADIGPPEPRPKATRDNRRIATYIRNAVRELKRARKELGAGEIESHLHAVITGLNKAVAQLEGRHNG